MQNFDELELIRNLTNVDLKIEEIDRIRHFPILWSLYEKCACSGDANFTKIENAVETLNSKESLKLETWSSFIEYFRNRYLDDNGNEKNIFQDVFRESRIDSEYKDKVRKVLKKEVSEPREVLKALLFILYRFRNNLFHGNKELPTLPEQIENFKVANNILKIVLEMMKKYNLLRY